MNTATFRIWRGDAKGGQFHDYTTEVVEGMVVLDAVHRIQATQANDLACRWNCKAGKCGSCSAEINGLPRLMCMTRLNQLPIEKPVTVEPMKAFPLLKDLVTDVSWNFRVKKNIKRFKPRPPDAADGTWRMAQTDIDRVQEFRKCIECFLCQDVCHVLRDHHKHDEFIGPRYLVYVAALEMHPLDTESRLAELKQDMYVEINTADAHDRGIKDGAWVWVTGAENNSKTRVKAQVTERVGKGVAWMPFHFAGWFQGVDQRSKYPAGTDPIVLGESVNTLTTYGFDPATGMQEPKATLCQIRAA